MWFLGKKNKYKGRVGQDDVKPDKENRHLNIQSFLVRFSRSQGLKKDSPLSLAIKEMQNHTCYTFKNL